MTLGEEQEAFMLDVVKLINEATSRGYKVRGGELQRTIEQQQIYMKTGRSKTMNSKHIEKLAIDLHFRKEGEKDIVYPKELGDFWESLSPQNEWGGNWSSFKDGPHFQRNKA